MVPLVDSGSIIAGLIVWTAFAVALSVAAYAWGGVILPEGKRRGGLAMSLLFGLATFVVASVYGDRIIAPGYHLLAALAVVPLGAGVGTYLSYRFRNRESKSAA